VQQSPVGYEVDVASSGSEALSKVNVSHPELVISDCVMPGMSGLELSANLKNSPALANLPVLLMSGSLRCDVAAGANYDGFLRKPFLAEALLREVQRLLDEPRVTFPLLRP